jgi:riboflavin-specific deaminase-like protein
LKLSLSCDGFIDDQKSVKISSDEDLLAVQKLRKKVDAILVGSNTIRNDNPRLLVKDSVEQPSRVLIEGKNVISLDSLVFTDKSAKTIIYKSSQSPDSCYPQQVEIKKYDGEKISIESLCQSLKSSGINIVLVEGGAKLAKQFIESNLVDAYRFAISSTQIKNSLATSLDFCALESIKQIKPKIENYGQTYASWYLMNKEAENFYSLIG